VLLVAVWSIAAVVLGSFLTYRRQIVSYLTHWKGNPTHTEPYVALDPAPELHVAVAGDIGDSGSRLDATAAAIATVGSTTPYDVLLLLGDNVYPSGDPAKLADTVFTPFAAVLDEGADLLAILGNHDVRDGNGAPQMEALGMPGRWWSTTYLDGDVLIVGLDSTMVDDPEQRAWLDDTLGVTDASWKIIAVHHPPYSAGYQGSNLDVRTTFGPLFAEHGVQLVLSGHDHDYQRSELIDGVTYVVTGGASGTRRTGEDDFTAVSFSWHHFVDIGIFADRLVLRAVNQDGRVADEATITLG
jgi:3',5'-cyclic AMP phosphodiesterase CpdA